MATTITREDMVYASFPIQKWTEDDNGDLLIYGKATDGTVDSDRQIVDPEWSGPALAKWLATKGNVRVQHSPHLYPAGKGVAVEIDRDGDGAHWVKSRIVEPTAKKLVKAGVLQDYSVGIARPVVIRDVTGKAAGGIVTGNDETEIAELSIVDRGANYNSGFTVAKSADRDVPWSYGDLEALLAKAEAAELTKSAPAATEDAEPEDKPDADGPAEDESGEPDDADDVTKSYDVARSEWLAREPKGDSLTGTSFLAKRAAWQSWHAEGDAEGLDGTEDGRARWAEKRKFEPNVGGGVDRDKLKDSDFVFPAERKFPVATPGDVADAVSSWGRYKGEATFDEFKAKLTALAHRKGEAFVAKLPEDWAAKKFVDEPEVAKVDESEAEKACTPDEDKCDMAAEPDVAKSDPLPADVADGPLTPGNHREPDGNVVERLEDQAGVAEPGECEVPDKLPPSVKTAEADYATLRMHDATCAAYDWDAVLGEYPALKSVSDAVVSAWVPEQVDSLAKADPTALADARAMLHKAFAQVHHPVPVPASMTPGQFTRPYVCAGHAPQTGTAEPNVPPASHTPAPDQFNRGPLADGHQDPPPASLGDNNPGPTVTGSSRTYYTRAARDQALNAMQAMHDHIAATFPHLCPMAATKAVLPEDMRATARPEPREPLVLPKAPGEKSADVPEVVKAEPPALNPEPPVEPEPAPVLKTVVVPEPAVDYTQLVADAVRVATDDIVKAQRAQAAAYETQLSALRARIDDLESQPDPAQAPLRGVVAAKAAMSEPAPVERRSLVAEDQVARQRAEYIGWLGKMAGHADPNLRWQAETLLQQMTQQTTHTPGGV